uniref:Uncharacterized protein n=1 Tax=Anopheles coluzzii TaxID=1518534 RepID=A0A8W7Q188_ANOCL
MHPGKSTAHTGGIGSGQKIFNNTAATTTVSTTTSIVADVIVLLFGTIPMELVPLVTCMMMRMMGGWSTGDDAVIFVLHCHHWNCQKQQRQTGHGLRAATTRQSIKPPPVRTEIKSARLCRILINVGYRIPPISDVEHGLRKRRTPVVDQSFDDDELRLNADRRQTRE